MSIFKEQDQTLGRKALRELLRVRRQIQAYFAKRRFRRVQKTYDALWPDQMTITAGQAAIGAKVAIVVLFQPNGLRQSLFETCRHLIANGYAVLAVSNAPVSKPDRQALAPFVWKICERPNYGYDAGAYRDGVWLLRRESVSPERLILMNDSIWFPLGPQNTTITRLEARDAPFTGLVHKTKPKKDTAAGQSGFIEAYFYLARLPNAHPADPWAMFWDQFWDELALTTGREHLTEGTISYAATEAGFGIDAIASRQKFLAAMAALPLPELLRVLTYAAYPTQRFQDIGTALLNREPSPQWRQDVLAHMTEVVNLNPFYGAFIYGSEITFGLGFLKRTDTPLFRETRKAYLRAVRDGVLPTPSSAVLQELAARPTIL